MKLEQGIITPSQFLNQITFDRNELFNELLDFTGLCLNEGEEEIEEQLEEIVNTNNEEETANKSRLCGVCTVNLAKCVHLPCRHCYFCEECYNTWKQVDTDAFENIDAPIDSPMLRITDEMNQKPLCPICREPIATTFAFI